MGDDELDNKESSEDEGQVQDNMTAEEIALEALVEIASDDNHLNIAIELRIRAAEAILSYCKY